MVIGYHGTSGAACEQILSAGFKVSANDYDWLGDGIYFFEDAPRHAWEWAQRLFPVDPAVIQAEIDLRDCIDLKDVGWASFLNRAHDQFVARAKAQGIALPRQSTGAHRLDREVINLAVEILQQNGISVASVRGVFSEGGPAFPGSFLFEASHVQIAVRDLSVISHCERLGAVPHLDASAPPRLLGPGGGSAPSSPSP